MKKYIKPEAVSYSADIESLLLDGTFVHNEEGSGIQRSKGLFYPTDIIDDETEE
ncbi:MAG: hypothetical protein MJZ32_05030 [Bacteroidaceae bacterium]|nr:hypothetical protein [Bacteroidaceae bacterium]